MMKPIDLNATVPLTIIVQVKQQRLSDILCSAIEGGSNYWAQFRKTRTDEALPVSNYVSAQVLDAEGEATRYRTVTLALMYKGVVALADRAYGITKPSKSWHFSAQGAARHLNDFINENDDAITADVILQFALFGEVLYS